jgi:hypothetical protein
MAEDMIERVRQAVGMELDTAGDWHTITMAAARASIAAMREPTTAMLTIGECSREQWQRMIDHALASAD